MKAKLFWIAACKWLLVVAALIAGIAVLRTTPIDYKNINQYVTSDVVYADGGTAHFADKNFGMANKGDVATLHIQLPPQPFFENSTLVFYDFSAVTQVWCEGVLLDSYGEDIAAEGWMIGNHAFFIAIPDSAWGGEITVSLRATESPAFSNFTNIKVYPAESVYRFYTDGDQLGFVVALALLVFGVVGLIALLFGKMRGSALKSGLCLVFAMLLVSLWMITNKIIYDMFGFTAYFWQPLEYIAGYALPIPFLLFYQGIAEKESKWSKAFGIAAGIVGVFFVITTVLNFTNILHYDAFMDIGGALIVASGVLLMVYSVRVKSGTRKAKTLLRTGMLVFVSTCLYEVVIRSLFRMAPLAVLHDLPSLMAIGVVSLLSCMTGTFVFDLHEKQKNLLSAQIKADTLDEVIDATPAGICQLIPNDQLTMVAANRLFYEIMGYRDDELKNGKPHDAFKYLFDSEWEFLRSVIDEIVHAEQTTGEYELTTIDVEGRPITVIIRYFYDREGSGNITANLIDITDRKRMEEELRVSEDRYRLALAQSGKVFFFFDVPTRTMRLSQELADAFGLPLEVDDMPNNFISQGLVEPESVDSYRGFYERIFAGEERGEAVISCHVRRAPDKVLWYKIIFTSVFDSEGKPISAIITYENMDEQHHAELSSRWKQLNLISVPEQKYVIATYDLTLDRLLTQTGGLFTRMPEFVSSYDEINAFVIEHFFHEDDRQSSIRFFERQRMVDRFRAGKTEDYIEYRSLQNGSVYRWTSVAVSLIEDPYNAHIMAQLLFKDIHDSKSGEIQLRQNMEDLQKELDNSRIRIMINQMQPHFLYNALSAIQTIVKVDQDYAYRLLHDFTVHLRSSIRALSSDEPIAFSDELKNIKAYLNIEQMRFGDKLHVNYEIDCDDFKVIPLSIQPLAENAARHGVYPKGDEGGTVTVRTYEAAQAYVVEVQDDGDGFDVDDVLGKESGSIGLKNLIFRLKSLMDADVTITSEPGKGTMVRVTIPIATREGITVENDHSR